MSVPDVRRSFLCAFSWLTYGSLNRLVVIWLTLPEWTIIWLCCCLSRIFFQLKLSHKDFGRDDGNRFFGLTFNCGRWVERLNWNFEINPPKDYYILVTDGKAYFMFFHWLFSMRTTVSFWRFRLFFFIGTMNNIVIDDCDKVLLLLIFEIKYYIDSMCKCNE